MHVSISAIDDSKRGDFYRVHSEATGANWCYCVAWWVPTWEGWDQRTAEENRSLREGLFQQGQYDGYLLYLDGKPVGWCQCGPRDRLPKLLEQYNLVPDPRIWAITCLFIAPRYRKRGLTHRFLAEVLEDLRSLGISHVQAFPCGDRDLPDEDVWTGPETAFQKAGFVLELDDSKQPVYSTRL